MAHQQLHEVETENFNKITHQITCAIFEKQNSSLFENTISLPDVGKEGSS